MTTLPTDGAERKRLQLYTYMFGYFPDAWLAEADVARAGNDQHNPGQPLHWAREKSKDQMNAAFNHLFDYGTGEKKDTDGCWHLAKAIWRLKAQLQLDIEAARGSGDWDDSAAWCADCLQALEFVRPGKYQHVGVCSKGSPK